MNGKIYKKNIVSKKLPGIGMRIVKSAIAVLLCYAVNLLRGDAGIVFYSQLAALWCIQMYRSNTKNNAIQRSIGTSIGAVYGLGYLLLIKNVIFPEQYLGLIKAIIISASIVLVLYTTVLVKKNQASYFSCVVFLSIVVNHAMDVNPYLFVLNRFLDTMIGIFIGIFVNDIRLGIHRDKETLYISGLDDILLDSNDKLSAFSKVELNRMIESGLKFTISTMRTPASLIEPMRDVNLKYPVIAMDGAVLYDLKKNEYINVYVISPETSKRLMDIINSHRMNWYANVIIDDTLLIYYSDKLDDVNSAMVDKYKTSPLRNYICRSLPEDESVVYFMLLDKQERIDEFYQVLVSQSLDKELKILTYPSRDYPGYAYIKIYNKNACKENMIHYLKEMINIKESFVFGTIPGHCDMLIEGDNLNEMVRDVRRMYEPIIRRRQN